MALFLDKEEHYVKLKSLVISLLSGMLITPYALAASEQEVDALITKINARTKALEQQVRELKGQVSALKRQKNCFPSQAGR